MRRVRRDCTQNKGVRGANKRQFKSLTRQKSAQLYCIALIAITNSLGLTEQAEIVG